jgi:hypothetical protein
MSPLALELSGIAASCNPDGSVKAKPDFDTVARPLAHELATPKLPIDAPVVHHRDKLNQNAYTNPNTPAIAAGQDDVLLSEILAQLVGNG